MSSSVTGEDAVIKMLVSILTDHLQGTMNTLTTAAGAAAITVGTISPGRVASADMANCVLVASRGSVETDDQFLGLSAPLKVEGEVVLFCLVGDASQDNLEVSRRLWARAVSRTLQEQWRIPTHNTAVLTGLRVKIEDEASSLKFRSDVAGLFERGSSVQSVVDPIRIVVSYSQRVTQPVSLS